MTNQSSPEHTSLLTLQINIFLVTVSKCCEKNGHSTWCVGVLIGVLCVLSPLSLKSYGGSHLVSLCESWWFLLLLSFFNSTCSWLSITMIVKFLKKLWCCLCGRVYQDDLVLSIELIRFEKMTFWVLALHQSNWADKQIVSFSTHHDSKFTLSINSADNMKLFWYNYKMLPLILLITLGHLLVPLFVTVIVFHNWYIVTVVLLLPFSDFLTLSLIQGLFSWTQETLYKVGGLAALFFSHFWNLPSFCQSVLTL